MKSERRLSFGLLRSRHPAHGWPQRSQLPPARASLSRTATPPDVSSLNISLTVSGSSFYKRVGFIESLRASKTAASAGNATGHLLAFALQKLRGSLRRIPATDAVFSKDFVNAHETCRRHNCRICGCERGL